MKKIICLALVFSFMAVGTVAVTMEPAHAGTVGKWVKKTF